MPPPPYLFTSHDRDVTSGWSSDILSTYVVSSETHSDLLNLTQRDALGILNYDLEICPVIVYNLYINIFSIRIVKYIIFPAMFFC
jgi:hypothetical protein